jgi:hypothetical protein
VNCPLSSAGKLSGRLANTKVFLDRADPLQEVVDFLREAHNTMNRVLKRFEAVADVPEFGPNLRRADLTSATPDFNSEMSCATAANPLQRIDSHRIGDVLQLCRTEVGDDEIKPSSNLAVGILGQTDRAWRSDSLQSRGDKSRYG